jgi:tetratricopeptide (TPR) repeat protein
LRILLLGALCLLSEAQAQSTGVPLTCAAAPSTRTYELPADGSDLRLRVGSGPAWLEVEEAGHVVTVADHPADTLDIAQPRRYGWHWLPIAAGGGTVEIRRGDPDSRAHARVKATLHCTPATELDARLAWLQRAARIGESLDTRTAPDRQTQTLAAIQRLGEDASGPLQNAIALHFGAESLFANGRGREAIAAFARAEQAWTALGDRERALAARVGHVEALRAIDANQAVVDQTPAVAGLHGAPSYFGARLENPRCLALQALGRLDEASACYDWLLLQFRALDEPTEYLVAAQNHAGLLRDRGDLKAAEEVGERSLDMARGPDAPMVRGRFRLMLADIALRRGQVTQAFRHAEAALEEFDHARFDAATWRAGALTLTAVLYSQLGANPEAIGALADAVRILATLDSPRGLAAAMNVFADIEANSGHDASALLWRRAAEETYFNLAMLPAFQATHALRLEQQARRGDVAAVSRELATLPAGDALHASRPLLLGAELALHEGHLDEARAALDRARRTPLSLRDQIHLALLESDLRDRSGDTAAAQDILLAAAQNVARLQWRAGNPALRHVVARQASPLRIAALQLLLEHGRDDATIESIWQWLQTGTEVASAAEPRAAHETAEAFDRAVADELLGIPGRPVTPADTPAHRELLSLLARPEGTTAASTAPAISLETLRRQLDADSAFLAYVDGGTAGAVLWITRDGTQLAAAAAPDDIRASAAALSESVRSASAPVAAIRKAARELSAQLLGAIPAAQPPRHLYVLADEPAAALAWSTLPWPDHEEPLAASTTVHLVHLMRTAATRAVPQVVNILVAAQAAGASAKQLPTLASADVEGAQIREALGATDLRVVEDAQATRASVLATLRQPNTWLHIAAHGTAQPQRIGYAGIWLEPSTRGGAPGFLSWLDVLDHGVGADLVVLDACQLGDNGSAADGNLSFADAVSRAGARQVIAAAWPVSDAASALWVPAFYKALADDPAHDAAQALRAAQQRLRASRAFTHPFFWAGLQAIERLEFPEPPTKTTASTHPTLH